MNFSESQPAAQDHDTPTPGRRSFLSVLSSFAMAFGLTSGYGMFAALAGRYLYPARPLEKRWLYVSDVHALGTGSSLTYETPSGQRVAITRLGNAGTVDDFIALSSVCPHLGCQVHWETQNSRFFCPCHNGAFDAEGRATAGPPMDARQSLSRFRLSLEGNLLFIEVPISA